MRVLITHDGANYHDVSNAVLDNDLDSVADIGGITTRGAILICCDVPTVQGFYFEFETPNNSSEITTEFSETLTLDSVSKIDRWDIKGEIVNWVQDSAGNTGHFEGLTKTLSGAAVNLGGTPNKVKIQCTEHGFVEGDVVGIRNTTNYNGVYTLPAQTGGDANNFVIEAAYTAESFSSPDLVVQYRV
jgi:hypothetical protein